MCSVGTPVVILEEVLYQWFTPNPSTPRLSPLLLLPDLKSDLERSDIPQNPGYFGNHGSLEETPSERSDSDCSSNSCDDASLELSTSLFSTVPRTPFPEDVSLFEWEDIVTQTVETTNALGLEFPPETVSPEDQAVATPTPQAESLRAPPHHQNARSFGCTYQEHRAFQGHPHQAPPSDTRANETLAGESPQDIWPRADVTDASGLEKTQGLRKSPDQRADTYPEYRKLHNEDLEDSLSARFPGQLEGAAAANGLSVYARNSQPTEWEFLRTPPMRPIPLPEEKEGGECLLYSGPNLGGWLNGTMDGAPKGMALKPPRRRFARAVV